MNAMRAWQQVLYQSGLVSIDLTDRFVCREVMIFEMAVALNSQD